MPQHVYCRVPALTPDSPGLETAGYDITSKDIPEMLSYLSVSGIGETQGISSIKHVYKHNVEVIKDTIESTVYARMHGYGVDGNAPELFGKYLAAHIIAAGTDISCHETTTKEEAIEKMRNGVYMLMREGSTQRNMPECIKVFTEEGFDSRRAILATDDMLAEDILSKGHMNDIIRRTILEGIDPVEAIQMATINASTWLGLDEIGILAPGKLADIVVIAGDIRDMNVAKVFLSGRLVAENNELLIPLDKYQYPESVKNTVNRQQIKASDLMIHAAGNAVKVRCIGLIPDQNLTNAVEVNLSCENNIVKYSVEKDILPIAVVGRHGQDNIGKSFVRGFQIKNGAIAESVSHDTHNIIVVGASYEDMAVAVNRVISMQGGVAVVKEGKVIGELPLRIAGLMTDELSASELTIKMKELHNLATSELECKVHAPLMHLAFLSLSTSAKWKITDKGLVDAENYCVIPTVITEGEYSDYSAS
jgi:adenine deaminase